MLPMSKAPTLAIGEDYDALSLSDDANGLKLELQSAKTLRNSKVSLDIQKDLTVKVKHKRLSAVVSRNERQNKTETQRFNIVQAFPDDSAFGQL